MSRGEPSFEVAGEAGLSSMSWGGDIWVHADSLGVGTAVGPAVVAAAVVTVAVVVAVGAGVRRDVTVGDGVKAGELTRGGAESRVCISAISQVSSRPRKMAAISSAPGLFIFVSQ